MPAESKRTIDTLLGKNNILLILPHAQRQSPEQRDAPLALLGRELAGRLHCYTVINARYKPELVDMNDVRAIRKRKKVTRDFLSRIKQFKEEISANNLLPLVLLIQAGNGGSHPEADLVFAYGQGERANPERPHRPTISPSFLAKIRLAAADQGFRCEIADPAASSSGAEPYSLNQLFRQKNFVDGFYDPVVRSLMIQVAPGLISTPDQARQTGQRLAQALAGFSDAMPLVRRIALRDIDTGSQRDMRYIFRIQEGTPYDDLVRESYIDELSRSIQRSGLLHPLVLLQKKDGRYKILCGFRRYQALKRLGREQVEAKTFREEDFTNEDFFNISLAENTRRRNLNPLEIGNFLDAASREMGLNNTRLAERFGETLGIGAPGKKVSQSTIHKYRKLNQIRERGESAEMIADIINEKLQFTIAAEILAPIKDPADRDSLYLEVIKPLSPTRPQLLQITKLLQQIHPHHAQAIAQPNVKKALAKASSSAQKAGSFLRLLKQDGQGKTAKNRSFKEQVNNLRRRNFGQQAKAADFDITPAGKTARAGVTLHLRLRENSTGEDIEKIIQLLKNKQQIDELIQLLKR